MKITANQLITVYMVGSSIAILALVTGMIYEGIVLRQVYNVANDAANSASDANNTAQDARDYAQSADTNAQDASDKATSICDAITGCI